jgi:hypothetical protein
VLPWSRVPPPRKFPSRACGDIGNQRWRDCAPVARERSVRHQLGQRQLVADEINTTGWIKELGGAKINLIVADSTSTPTTAGTVAQRLIKQEVVVAILGASAAWISIQPFRLSRNQLRTMVLFAALAAARRSAAPGGCESTARRRPRSPRFLTGQHRYRRCTATQLPSSPKIVPLTLRGGSFGTPADSTRSRRPGLFHNTRSSS